MRSTLRDAGAAALAVLKLASAPAVSAQPAGIEAQATKLLKASTDFLAGQQRFHVETRNTLEVVLKSGQKIQLDHGVRMWAERPDKIRSDRFDDVSGQSFFYDGKSLTMFDPGGRTYATVAAPGTLEGMLDMARTQLDIVMPAGDLIYRNAYDILMADVTQGFVVDKSWRARATCSICTISRPSSWISIPAAAWATRRAWSSRRWWRLLACPWARCQGAACRSAAARSISWNQSRVIGSISAKPNSASS